MSAAPEHDGSTIDDQVLELWFDGFDTAEITEACAANVIAREMDRRHAARQQGGARA